MGFNLEIIWPPGRTNHAVVFLVSPDLQNLPLFLGFITGLLNNVGTHIDPTRLIKVRLVKTCMHVLLNLS